jgi:adenylate cyclase
MTASPIDPAPRSYPPFVSLLRRSARRWEAAPGQSGFEAIEAWLLGDAVAEDDTLFSFEELAWRLVVAGLPLDRASLHLGTLHPQIYGFSWNWNATDGLCDEVKVAESALQTDAYRRNPLFGVIERGTAYRGKTTDPVMVARHPLMAELAGQGIVEYVALPLRTGGQYSNAVTVATKREAGFSDTEFAQLQHLLKLFALHVGRQLQRRIAGDVLDTYLGAAAGGRVLDGLIKRGAGEPIRSVIWVSDLRGFTDLSERLAGPDMITLLNAYFGCLAGTVLDHDGEVLKFIGDGLLAVFPFSSFATEKAAAEAALAAARQACAELDRLNAAPPAEIAAIAGWHPLRTGIALHDGEVFFGNVGAPARLDFTVIGRAVNAASRVEALSKSLGRSILITEAVAGRLDRPLDDLGRHALRGVAEPIALFSPPLA